MKKILVALLLSAGFVTTALADLPLYCPNNPSNQCCIDVQNINAAIAKSSPPSFETRDGYSIVATTPTFTNDGEFNTNCVGVEVYLSLSDGSRQGALFTWQPGSWNNDIYKVN